MPHTLTPMPLLSLPEKALLVHERLGAAYGAPFPFTRDRDPVSELVSALLSHRTRNADTGRALRQLQERFPTWEAVRDAETAAVEAAIAPATWPEQKAPRIQAALRTITEARGTLTLDFLAEMETEAARVWLQAIPGVGPKTSAAVVLFSRLRQPALLVDSHHHRVAQRLGLIPPNVGPGPAHDLLRAQLPAAWGVQELHDNHQALMRHGQGCCFFHRPACPRCPVLDVCPTGLPLERRERRDDAERIEE